MEVNIFCPVSFLVIYMSILPPKFFEIRYLPGLVNIHYILGEWEERRCRHSSNRSNLVGTSEVKKEMKIPVVYQVEKL